MGWTKIAGPSVGEALLSVSPFLVAGLVIYGFASLVGVRLGRWTILGEKQRWERMESRDEQ